MLYRTIKSDTDHHTLHTDPDYLTEWAMAWDMQSHPAKCLVMNISKKRHPSKFTYSLHNTDLKTTDTAKYLGIIISKDMKWTKHIRQTCSRANRAFEFIKRNVQFNLFPAHINISYSNDNMYIMYRKRNGQKTVLMNVRPLTITSKL